MSLRLFKSLLYKSTQIQREIDRESARRGASAVRLLKLKTLSLTIRRRLARLAEAHRLALGGPQLRLQPAPARRTR